MSDSTNFHPGRESEGRQSEVELLDVFYTSPNTELCSAALAQPSRETVIRRLPVAYRDDPNQRAQLRNEAAYLQSLDHPGVPRLESLLDTGTELIVPLAPARRNNLRQIMDLARSAETRLPLEMALQVLDQVLDAVEFVHETVLSGDISDIDISLQPEAVLVDEKGHVSLPVVRLSSPPYITSSIMGAATRRYFVYAAPEQCVAGRTPDRRACLYTLGMLCYELLTSQPLFSAPATGNPEAIIRRKLRLLHPLLSDVHPELRPVDGLLMALLEPVPDDRQADPRWIRRAIGAFSSTAGICSPEEIFPYLEDLRRAAREIAAESDDSASAARLSSVTDIAQYNAS